MFELTVSTQTMMTASAFGAPVVTYLCLLAFKRRKISKLKKKFPFAKKSKGKFYIEDDGVPLYSRRMTKN